MRLALGDAVVFSITSGTLNYQLTGNIEAQYRQAKALLVSPETTLCLEEPLCCSGIPQELFWRPKGYVVQEIVVTCARQGTVQSVERQGTTLVSRCHGAPAEEPTSEAPAYINPLICCISFSISRSGSLNQSVDQMR